MVIVCLTAALSHALTATRLETNGAVEPLGIDDLTPRLSWQIDSQRRGVLQTSARVLVATRPDRLKAGAADIWDSGVVEGGDPWLLPAVRRWCREHGISGQCK